MPNHPPQNLTIATTGASGSVFLRQLLLAVERDARVQTVNFIASDSALRVLAEELGIQGRANLVRQILSSQISSPKNSTKTSAGRAHIASKIKEHKIEDRKSKSNRTPISEPTWPAVPIPPTPWSSSPAAWALWPASPTASPSHLIERAADVCLKEKRPLVLCVRETPLNKIHIRNMYRAADAGATVFPLIPAFYYRPASLDDMAREFAYRVLGPSGPSSAPSLPLERLIYQRLTGLQIKTLPPRGRSA